MNKYNLNQLRYLESYFDVSEYNAFLKLINPSCSCYKIEILARAFQMGIDITDLVDCNVNPDCLILLCDSKMKGIDIKGLGNELIDAKLLNEIISIKKKNPNQDLSFIVDLTKEQCMSFVNDYRFYGTRYFEKYREDVNLGRAKLEAELNYIQKNK